MKTKFVYLHIPKCHADEHKQDIAQVKKAISDIVAHEDIEIWMHTPNKFLEGFTPSMCLEDGEVERVLNLIKASEDGTTL
ncbi:MAG: hypothetical protein A2932_01725 [Candidatus Spechtbacteria bacterium RIFCSPLOWO2_01_FULL_46_10]|uniref:Antitoxin Xre/MbcA/ParS-like toxin-binding domain-containing protein n=1 Tax=Candidatus Spechtbacteria bacterium RIFCSPLOWO2_01_FULL_46_10 TaxID=1802163 RepID=A0A1G2HG49_9BACT|nr:MAG: hypothetical protein A2932_01725 [Candidatus Spechtbacteria bacterium RIFCSPLOWO2_01_FULL_46_10]